MTNLLSKEETEQLIHDCQINGEHRLANTLHELLQRREAAEKPVAWISEQNLKVLGKQFSVRVKHEPVMVRPIPLFKQPPLTSAERERLTELERAHGNLVDLNLRNAELCGKLKEATDRLAAYDRAAKEPVGYTSKANIENVTGRNLELFSKEPSVYRDPIALFTAPPLPVVPDEFNAIIKHLQDAHNFIENTEAFGHSALNGILQCGDDKWDIDASKEALSVCRAAMLQLSGNSEQVDHSVDANEKANSPVIPEGSTPTRYMNRFTGMCYTLDQQPGADADTDVYVPLYERKPAKNTN